MLYMISTIILLFYAYGILDMLRAQAAAWITDWKTTSSPNEHIQTATQRGQNTQRSIMWLLMYRFSRTPHLLLLPCLSIFLFFARHECGFLLKKNSVRCVFRDSWFFWKQNGSLFLTEVNKTFSFRVRTRQLCQLKRVAVTKRLYHCCQIKRFSGITKTSNKSSPNNQIFLQTEMSGIFLKS